MRNLLIITVLVTLLWEGTAAVCADPVASLMACCDGSVLCQALMTPLEGRAAFESRMNDLVSTRIPDVGSVNLQLIITDMVERACNGTCTLAAATLLLLGTPVKVPLINSDHRTIFFSVLIVGCVFVSMIALLYYLCRPPPTPAITKAD